MNATTLAQGERLRSHRLRVGLSLTEAARRAGKKIALLHAYEHGKTASLDVLHGIATAIGADPHEIDDRLCPSAEAGTRTLTLVFSGADPERPALAGETEEDDQLVTELLPGACRLGYANDPDRGPRAVASVARSHLGRLIQAAGEARVKLVIRTDLAPRLVAPPVDPEPDPKPIAPEKGGARKKR